MRPPVGLYIVAVFTKGQVNKMEEEEIFDIESHTQANVPYFVHEAEMARQERTVKRLWILCIIMFLALVISNAGWIYYESQFQDEVITQEISQDSGEGGINTYNGKIVGGDDYGEAEDQDYGKEKN